MALLTFLLSVAFHIINFTWDMEGVEIFFLKRKGKERKEKKGAFFAACR